MQPMHVTTPPHRGAAYAASLCPLSCGNHASALRPHTSGATSHPFRTALSWGSATQPGCQRQTRLQAQVHNTQMTTSCPSLLAVVCMCACKRPAAIVPRPSDVFTSQIRCDYPSRVRVQAPDHLSPLDLSELTAIGPLDGCVHATRGYCRLQLPVLAGFACCPV